MADASLGYAFIKASETDPDQYARALTLAQPRQAPTLAVMANLPEAERLDKIDRLRSVIGDAPKLQQALKDDPDLLFLASDSIEPLSTLERLGDVGRSFMSGGARTIYQPLSAGYEATAAAGTALGNLFTGDEPRATGGTPDEQWLADSVRRARQAEDRKAGLEEMPGYSVIQKALENVDANDAAWYRRNLATDIAGAAGSLTGQIATAGLGGGTVSTLSLFGQGYQQGVENAQASGVYGTGRGDLGAALTAGVTGASEKIGLDLLTRPLARTGIAGRLAGLALGAGGEGLSEGAEQFGQNLVQRYVMGDQSIDPFAGVGYNAFLGLVTGGLFRAGIEGATIAKERADATTARNQALSQSLTEVMNSPFAKRSPEAATALAGKLLSADPDGSITIPAEQARVLFQADDGAFLPPDLQEEVNRKITAGLASGADIDIPISVLAHAAQAGKIEQVLEHARLADGDMTGAEAAKFSQADIGEEGRRLAQEMLNSIQPQEDQAAIDRIQSEIAQQLEAAGTAPDVAAQYASIEASRMQSRAVRRGTDVDTIAKESGLRIVGEFDGPIEGRTLDQPDGGGATPRGSVTFTSAGPVIRLFEQRNLSTVLHEFGHTWLEEMRYDASLPEAPDQLKADWETVRTHLGIAGDADIPTEAHESFARSAEAYFMEGKAPSLSLAGAFNRFRAWLANIYRSLRNLNVTMTPEIRGVFDRLLATDDQIAAMQASEAWTTLDQTLLDGGLTDAERKRYAKLSGEARDEAERVVMNKVMAEVRADHKQTLKDMRPQIQEQVEQDANTDQHLLAVEWLKENGGLSRSAVEDVLGVDGAKAMQRGTVNKKGADPEMVAPLLGYESGAEMLQALAQTPTRKQWVEAETERRLAEAFPDPIVTGEAQNAGWAAIHSDKRAEVLALELKALRKLKADQIVKKGVERQGLGQSTRTGKEGRQATNAEAEALEGTESDQTRGGDATAQAAQLNADAVRSTDNAKRREAYAAEQRWKSELATLAENAQAVRVAAQNAASQMTVADLLRTDRHRSAEAKAAAEVQDALTRRDFETAIEAKTRQIYAHHLARASAEAREATQKQIKKFARVLSDRVKMKIDPDYRARARQLLAAYDFGPKLGNQQQMLLELQAFNEWIQAKQKDDAAQFVIPDRILRAQELTNYRDMTYADFQALGDSVDNVITQGRLKNRLLAERDKIALDQARAELADTARQNVRENGRPEIGTERFQRLRDTLRGVLSSLKKTETLVKELDGGKENGPWAQLIYKPLSDAADAETTRKAAAVKDLQNLFSVFSKADLKAMNSKISVPELNGSLSKWELLSFALNTGNESSLEALTEGYKIKPETVSAVIDRYLTKRDMDFVQSVWNYVNSFWPEIAAQEKRLTGVEPAKVEAMPVQTSHGTYAGGYYPLKYRSDSKPNSAAQIAEENYRQMIGGGVNRAATRHGHTIERQGSGGRRVALDIGLLFGHIDSVIHDLTHREAVIDTHRLLTGGNVHSALVDTVGQEGFLTIDQTIRAVAGGQVAPTDDLQKIVQYVRGGTVIRALGLNLANALQNLTGVLPATGLVGEKRMAMHALPFLARPDQWRANMAWIKSKSPMMAARLQNFDRDVFQFGASLDPRRARRIKFQSWVNAPVAYTDNLTAGAVWIAAYNKAMAGEASVNAEDGQAVAYADSVVRRSLSSGRQLDLAQLQRGNEYMKLLTTFIGYFQAIYNLNVENVKGFRQGNIGATRAAMNLMLINVIPATIGQAMLGGPDDDESWWHWLAFANLRWITGGIPLVRDLASVADFGSAPKTALAQVGEDIYRAGQGAIRLFTDDDVTRAQVRGAVNTVGTLAHLPTNQFWKTGDALLRWWEGEDGIGLYDAVVGAPPKK